MWVSATDLEIAVLLTVAAMGSGSLLLNGYLKSLNNSIKLMKEKERASELRITVLDRYKNRLETCCIQLEKLSVKQSGVIERGLERQHKLIGEYNKLVISESDSSILFMFGHKPTKNEIKARYKILCKAFHPDVGGSVEAIQIVNNSYEQELIKYDIE